MTPDEEAAVRDAARALADALVDVLRASPEGVVAPDQLYSVDQACEILGCGRSLIYSELAAGRLHSLKVRRRRLIPSSAIAQYVESGSER